VIGVWVRENDPVHRLVKAARVSGRLIRVGTHQLSVEDDELRWPFKDVGVDEPSVRRACIRVDRGRAAAGDSDRAVHEIVTSSMSIVIVTPTGPGYRAASASAMAPPTLAASRKPARASVK